MKCEVPKGMFIVAVSAGVDSMSLLHMIHELNRPNDFVVAHYNHGIREDSYKDTELVSNITNDYGMKYEYEEGLLGANASELTARTARYDFLRRIMNRHKANAIITAHHQDDYVETMLLHVLRGTGRTGLNPMERTKDVLRPLLTMTKKELVDYAKSHRLTWNEDSTNTDQKYLRNKLRHKLASDSVATKSKLLNIAQSMRNINKEADDIVSELLDYVSDKKRHIIRQRFVFLPHSVASEVLVDWLKQHEVSNINRSNVERLVLAVKTGVVGNKIDADKTHWLVLSKNSAEILQK